MKVRAILSEFIHNLDDFLSAEAGVDSGIKVVFATEPQKIIDGYVVYGAVSLLNVQYPFEVRYNKHLKTVEISSQIFWFKRSLKLIKEFLKQVKSH
jgi:hypothetical protein